MSAPTATLAFDRRSIPGSRVWRTGLLAIAASVAANLALLAILNLLVAIPAGFAPLTWPTIAIVTAVAVLVATAVFALIARVSRRPARAFQIVAALVFVAMLAPDLLLLTAQPAPFPGISPLTVGLLMLMHVFPAIITVGLFSRLAGDGR